MKTNLFMRECKIDICKRLIKADIYMYVFEGKKSVRLHCTAQRLIITPNWGEGFCQVIWRIAWTQKTFFIVVFGQPATTPDYVSPCTIVHVGPPKCLVFVSLETLETPVIGSYRKVIKWLHGSIAVVWHDVKDNRV